MTAHSVVNGMSAAALEEIIATYGEERAAKRIAAAICNYREIQRIETTKQLAEAVQIAFGEK